MLASPYAKSIRPMRGGRMVSRPLPDNTTFRPRPDFDGRMVSRPLPAVSRPLPDNTTFDPIRRKYDILKKEAADQRANGFMGRVVLPTENQTFEQFRDERKNSIKKPMVSRPQDPNNFFSTPVGAMGSGITGFMGASPVSSLYGDLSNSEYRPPTNVNFRPSTNNNTVSGGEIRLSEAGQALNDQRDRRRMNPNPSLTADFGMPKPNFNQSSFDDFMGGLTQVQRNLIGSYGANQTYQARQQYRNPNMGMGIGGQRPTGMGMFGGFPQRPSPRPQGIMGGFGRPQFPQMMQRPQPYNPFMQRPQPYNNSNNFSGYGGMQRPQPMMNYSGYGGMQRPQQNYGMRPQQNYGMQQPQPQQNYSGYGQQPQQTPYQQYGMQGGGYQQSPYQQPYPQPQQYGGYGMSQGYGGQGGFAPMSNPYQPQQYGNPNNFSGYGMQQGPFTVEQNTTVAR